MESWNCMGRTANMIIKDIIDIYTSISKNMHILRMGRYYCKYCLSVDKLSKMPWNFYVSWNKFSRTRVKAIWVNMGVQPIWIGIYVAAKCVFFLSWRCSMAAATLWSSGQLPAHDPCHAEFVLENIANIRCRPFMMWSIFSKILTVGIVGEGEVWGVFCEFKVWLMFCLCHCRAVYHIEAETKWPPFRRQHFQLHSLEWKCLNFA